MFAKASRIPLLLTMLLLPLFAGAATTDKGAAAGPGSVSGTIKDAAGAVLQGAQVVLQPTATSVASDAQGIFVIPNIAPGTYTVTVSYVGFDNSVATIVVTSGQAATKIHPGQCRILAVAGISPRSSLAQETAGPYRRIPDALLSSNIRHTLIHIAILFARVAAPALSPGVCDPRDLAE